MATRPQQKELRALKGKDTPARITSFDIETEGWTKPYAIGYYDGTGTTDGVTIHEGHACCREFLTAFLTDKHRSETCYAHNGGRFDFSFLLDELRKKEWHGYEVNMLKIQGRIAQVKIKKHKNVWTLRDSVCLLPDSLERLSKTFKVEHGKLVGTVDFDAITRDGWRKHIDTVRPYLINDVMGLAEIMTAFQDLCLREFGCGIRDSLTLAALAMRVYRRNHLKIAIPTYENIERNVRQAYYGGRVEIFKTHVENAHYYDVNSLYPSVMATKPMPVGRPVKDFDMTIDDFGILQAEIIAPDNLDLPVLPYKQQATDHKQAKLLFPVGRWTGWYCSPELQKARDLGYQIKVKCGYRFDQAVLFDTYVKQLYAMKQAAPRDSPIYMVSKSLANSLYGKFGQRRDRKTIELLRPDTDIGKKGARFVRDDAKFLECDTHSESAHILPAIAAFVTSYARLSLYDHMAAANTDGGLAYCDTDSVITTTTLPTGSMLGQLKDEVPCGIRAAYFVLPKLYTYLANDGHEEVRSKGFPRGTFTHDQIRQELEGKNAHLTHTRKKLMTPFESMRRTGSFVGMGDITRTIKTRYDKRTLVGEGKTKPVTIDGDQPPDEKAQH